MDARVVIFKAGGGGRAKERGEGFARTVHDRSLEFASPSHLRRPSLAFAHHFLLSLVVR
jgi:hypothetical protein